MKDKLEKIITEEAEKNDVDRERLMLSDEKFEEIYENQGEEGFRDAVTKLMESIRVEVHEEGEYS